METAAPTPARKPAWRVWTRRLAPWVITAGVVAYLLHEYSLASIVAEMGRGNALGLVPVGAVLVICTLLTVSLADWLVVHGILGGPRYVDIVRGKAASSLLDVVGYAIGHSGYAVWIARRGGTDALTAAGIMLYVMASDLTAVCLVTTIVVWSGGDVTGPFVRIGAPTLAGVLILLKVVGPLRLMGERTPRVFHPWSGLSRRRAFLQLAVRTGNIYISAVGVWVAFQVFGLEVPLWAVAVYMPVVLLVGSLPVNVAGFGAVQAAWLLFEPWATGEQILAFQFLWRLVVIVAIVLRGLPFVRRMVVEIDAGAPEGAKERSGAAV